MYEYLRQHPQIYMPGGDSLGSRNKEPHFFGSDLSFTNGARPVSSMEQYLGLFNEATEETRLGEASVWYLMSRCAATEIRRFSPDARIIVMLRNPVDVMYRIYNQGRVNGMENIARFEDALDAEESRVRGRRLPPVYAMLEHLLYRRSVQFADQLERYFDQIGPERTHVILFEDFTNDTAAVYTSTLQFLGVREHMLDDFPKHNPALAVRHYGLQRWLQHPPRILGRLGRMLLPASARDRLGGRLILSNVKAGKLPTLDAGLRRRLQAELAPQVNRLSELLRRDMSHWLREPSGQSR